MGWNIGQVRMSLDYIFSRYSVGDQLGKGGFGVVYEGRRLEDDLKVALKYVTKTEDMECIDIIALTFLANKGRRVPEIIRLLDWTDHPDHFVMVLECPSPCENLVEFMRRHGGSLDEHTCAASAECSTVTDFDLHLLQYKRWSKPGLSKECCDLLSTFLNEKPIRRIGLGQIWSHNWF
ncbi:serine threonine- kinase pim-1-like protein [Labeo rohita]|uniref:non-specific serine/threonine protein kinase n=1 Tax=Labeo rohita TaxID=84645 RepID=A0A498MUZ7_LABRO|nr:serine threonine- kinase pim-1-like protein [Labeo rohita]